MNWIRQNSFLAGLFAVTTALAIALGVLVYMAYDKYSTVSEEFGKQATELKRLQSLVPYPSEENLKKVKAQRESMDAKIQSLQQSLTKMAIPVDPTTPEQFQDKLRTSVLALIDLAKQKEVKLPEKFYLGFDGYQTSPPKPEATFALANQMAGVELVVRKLIDSRVAEIKAVKRAPLPEEEAKTPAQSKQLPVTPVNKTSFEVEFRADQSRARSLLDSIVGSKDEFYIIRSLHVENEKLKAPSKSDPDDSKAGAGNVAATTDSGKPADAAPQMKFILGTEKVDVIAQIEIVKFKGSTSK